MTHSSAPASSVASPERLGSLFCARSVAIVGASETSNWAKNLMGSLALGSGVRDLHFVHPKYEEQFGFRTVPSLVDLDGTVDLAFVMVGPTRVEQVLHDAATAGVRSAVVLAAGYGELGPEGRELQERLSEAARRLDITVLGPNTIGFINASDGIVPWAVASTRPPLAGPVAAVFESGSMARATYEFAQAHAIGSSIWASLGNSAVVNSMDVLEYLIDDERTKSIALFLETVRDSERLMELGHRALERGKPIVAFKAGRSEEGARSAMAHTGAMATDDVVVDAAFRQAGIVRVESIEELVSTAGLLGYTSKLPTGCRMGVVTSSGGGCNIIADLAKVQDLSLPEWNPTTIEKFRTLLPPFAHVLNPLDTTGFGHARQRPRSTKAEDDLAEMAATDPGVDFIYSMMTPLPAERPEDPTWIESRMAIVGQIVRDAPVPVILSSNTCLDIFDYPRSLLEKHNLFLLPGADLAMKSIGAMARWVDRAQNHRTSAASPSRDITTVDTDIIGAWAEDEGRDLLRLGGVPIVPSELVTTVSEAIDAALEIGYPVALKVCSRDIPHKTDVGGVRLGVAGAKHVHDAYEGIIQSCSLKAPDAEIRGVLISPMRPPGIDLLVGVTWDDTFGPVLTVGLGGVWVEVMKDVSVRVLPVSDQDIYGMLLDLRGSTLLTGGRGSTPVDLEALTRVIQGIASAALTLGDRLEALEVNPLRIGDAGMEALDVLVTTRGVG